ncbi:hypothetical protein [Melittangium boletus]|uniref:Lipoprotein n=1 Tax=Melittangium boletus DSM 14713 TaxID=1294270 RepID=A0A250IUH8_9BACT|nr:hypothetical protein [Melittangium boletus]ATB34586.1 hypothetical protein MEBOL_008091 [Melittangium boletus DSM 14713]
MRHIKGVCIGAIAAALLLGTGCKPNQPVRPQNPSMEQGTGGSSIQSPESTDSAMGTGTGGSGLSNDTGSSPYMGTHDAGTGGVQGQEPGGMGGSGPTGSGTQQDNNTREPAPGTTQGNDASHRNTDPGADQGPNR